MSDEQPPFGPSNQGPRDADRDDLGGSKWISPYYGNRERFLESTENLKRMRWSRRLTIAAAALIGCLCLMCLLFSFYVGTRYLSHIERLDNRQQSKLVLAVEKTDTETKENPSKNKIEGESAPSPIRDIEYLAPLLPGFLSSLFAVISIITLARFVSIYGRNEPETKVEYGAIRALVAEISELIKSFRGKD